MAKPFVHFPVPLTTVPMEAKIAESLPDDEGWQYEPKWDGFRALAFRDGDAIELRGKSGKTLTRYFPDVVQILLALSSERFVLDGELAIPLGKCSVV
jgi:ATP-dependent DNA ligase